MTTAQRIVKNFGLLATGQVISQLLGFVAVIYLARILGAGSFGKITLLKFLNENFSDRWNRGYKV